MKKRKEGKITSFRKLRIAIISRLWAKRSLVLLKAWLRQACQKIVVHVQTKFFTKKFFESLINFSSFPELQQKFFRIWRENFGRVVTTTFIHVHRNIFREVVFLSKSSKFFSWFSESELQMCGLSEKIICYRCQDCILRC